MKRLRTWFERFRWQKLVLVWAVFLLIGVVLFAERSGVQYSGTHFRLELLEPEEVLTKEEALRGQPVTCLLICDTSQDGVAGAKEEFDQILQDMKVAAQTVDLAKTRPEALPDFAAYQTVVILMPNLDGLEQRLIDLMEWVEEGGNALFAMAPVRTSYFDVVAPKLGILSASWSYEMAESIVPAEGFMLGGGQRYEFSDPFESALQVHLREEAAVYAVTGDEGLPLIWSNELGKGRVVVDNIGIYGKVVRGFYAASYSLLGDAAAYPVLNSAVFFLDDFPSPVPSGDGEYIRRDYGLSISDFYTKIWWPDLMRLAQRYGVRFTGVID